MERTRLGSSGPQFLLGEGPGLAKVRVPADELVGLAHGRAVVAERRSTLWSIHETWIAALFEEADTFSEGDAADEPAVEPGGPGRRVYYGSTSLRCPLVAVRARLEGVGPREHVPPTELAQALLANPHARLCAVRIARREASFRCGGVLNVMHAEISARVLAGPDGVRLAFDVDVSAEVARLHERVLPE
ncbi:MAG: hypothetical protein FJ095_01370 [Deltaproteobacteria bacterium]|nr:hypothetical protein [Deltaproteobacteria bacterium]